MSLECAKLFRETETVYYFKKGNGDTIQQSKNYIIHWYKPVDIGDCLWFSYDAQEKKYFFEPEDHIREIELLTEGYNVGNTIYAYIVRKTDNELTVQISPSIHLNVTVNSYEGKEGDLQPFRILELHTGEEFFIRLEAIMIDDDFPNLEDIFISDGTIERLNNERKIAEPLKEKMGLSKYSNFTREMLKNFLEIPYEKCCANHVISRRRTGNYIKLDFPLGIKDTNGVPLSVYINKGKTHETYYLSDIGNYVPQSLFQNTIYVTKNEWPVLLDKLSELTLDENWDFPGEDNLYILKQYFIFSFYKVYIDGLLYENGNNAIFNTGLVDKYYDEIYCALSRSDSSVRWKIKFFACLGKGEDGKKLNEIFSEFPEAPSYIDVNHLENIYFDTSKDFFCDYVHIIEGNIHRIPLNALHYILNFDTTVREKYSVIKEEVSERKKKRLISELYEYISEQQDLKRKLEDSLKTAVETAKKYCKWNYKTAVPMYYPVTNSISLLLPLELTGRSGKADLALVVERMKNGNYQGQTILTLEMAYQDARQICRFNNEWLVIGNLTEI